jgi:hypothetical protein
MVVVGVGGGLKKLQFGYNPEAKKRRGLLSLSF